MDNKYLIPLAIGVGVLVLVLIGALLFTGQEEGAGGVAVIAAAAAETARRRRAAAGKELDEIGDEAEDGIADAEGLRDEAKVDEAAIDTDVEGKSLKDLVDEENER